ncbi:MAG: hypothetical protein LH616_16545, partial [Ilumatobacteraceae bacterium]|nr:hypothetical protein [Ilumatobacteraceae bacterium]
SELDVPTIGVSAVRRHGSTRQHRRRAGLATVSAVSLLGAGVLTVQRLSSNPSPSTGPAAAPSSVGETTPAVIDTIATTISDGSGPDLESLGEPVQRVDSAFVWNAVEPGSAEAVTNLVWGIGPTQEAPYFAWSTAPGPTTDGSYQPVLYRSDDGIRWAPAADGTFTEPQVSKRGLASQNGILFAFGTAAATAAIPQGGAGDAVVDISSDGGASWQPQVLPLDLRSLAAMDGVGGVGMSGGIAAANGVVVAVAQPNVWWDAQSGRELIITADGAYAITYPVCEGQSCVATMTTVVRGGVSGTATENTAPAGTEPADTAPVAAAPQVEDTIPKVSDLLPFDELGIDPASVAASRTPRAFISTDGATFSEVDFPAMPDTAVGNGGDIRVFAAGDAFYVTLSTTILNPSADGYGGYVGAHLLYRSTDGASWQQVGNITDSPNQELLGVMADGTLVGRAYASDGSMILTTSVDGVTSQGHDLRPLFDPSDGKIVYVDLWVTSVDEQGITAIGAISNDPIAEAGGRSLERDGVRLEVPSVRSGGLFAYDIATGEEIPQNLLAWSDPGMSVLGDDGATRAAFTNDELTQLQSAQDGQLTTKVLLHSDDGVNWSRENLADLTGSPVAGPGFIQTQDGKVLITLIDPSRRTNTLATTIVLVGTRK